MDNDFRREQLLSLAEAARTIPGQPHIATLHRWRLRGIRGIKLRTVKAGGRRFVSQEALAEFFCQTTAAADGKPAPVRTSKRRQRAIEAAERELDRAGITDGRAVNRRRR